MSFDAILAIPSSDQSNDILSGLLGGMPFLTRQLRLLAKSGARRIVVVHGPDIDSTALTQALLHRLTPKNIDISLKELRKCNDATHDWVANEVMVLPAGNVLDHRCFDTPRSIVSSEGSLLLWFGRTDTVLPALHALTSGEQFAWPPSESIALPADRIAIKDDLPTAEQRLWDSCRKPIDGLISANFNRHVSLAISRNIVSLPITPNQVTFFSIAVGLSGAACLPADSHAMTLLGAFLLQMASILDGVDGELARMRVQFSLTGEWLDTVGDDVVNIAFILTFGLSRWLGSGMDGWAMLALYCAGTMALVAGIYYVWIARSGRGDILSVDWFAQASHAPANWRERARALGTRLFRRDLLIALILLSAVFGALQWALLPIALGATATLGAQIASMLVRREKS